MPLILQLPKSVKYGCVNHHSDLLAGPFERLVVSVLSDRYMQKLDPNPKLFKITKKKTFLIKYFECNCVQITKHNANLRAATYIMCLLLKIKFKDLKGFLLVN